MFWDNKMSGNLKEAWKVKRKNWKKIAKTIKIGATVDKKPNKIECAVFPAKNCNFI